MSGSASAVHTAVFRLAPGPSPAPSIPPKPRVEVRSVPKPTIGPGELLVRVSYAAIQPGDLLWMSGAIKLPRETTEPYAGASGAGIVEETAAGLEEYKGKSVMLSKPLDAQPNTVGMWTEYARIVPTQCAILPSSVLPSSNALQHYSGSLANSCTTWAFLQEHVIPSSGAGVVITAAAGATGRAMLAFSARLGIRAVAVVRSAADSERLRALQKNLPEKIVEGKDWWLLRSDVETFPADATAAIAAANATIVFDCVTGQLLSALLPALLPDTQIFVFSALDRTPVSLPGMYMMGKRLVLRTFSVFRSATLADSARLRNTLQEISGMVESRGEHLWTSVGSLVPAAKAEEAVKEAAEKHHTQRIVLDFTGGKAQDDPHNK